MIFQESLARTATFTLPKEISKLVRQGVELGDADNQFFNRKKSGQGTGTVGWLTKFGINRDEYYRHAIVLALIPFMNPSLY
mmetsp:Transcript_12458/g.22630  ORF Transcript_12458/g.22630 Transcript_12458/m.22630 type:complete len:81 (+) Transcript_12458:95-337(+)